MRAAALAVAVFGAFIGVMYLRFSGDAVPEPPPRPSSGASIPGNCFIARLVGAPEPTPAPAGAPPTRVPCSTVSASDPSNPRFGLQPPPPPPAVLGGVDVIPLEVGPEIELPPDIALIVQGSCGNCPGSLGGLSRVYRDSAGQIRTDALATRESLGFASGPKESYVTGYAIYPDGSSMAISVCAASCDLGPGSAQTTILRSLDGGISWSQVEGPGAATSVVSVLTDRRVIAAYYYEPGSPAYQIFPGGETLIAPSGASGAPIALPTGDLLWPTDRGRPVRSDGTEWLGAWAEDNQLQFSWKFVFDQTGERVLASATTRSTGAPGSGLVVIFRTDGSLERAYSVPGYVDVVAWLDEGRALANANSCDSRYSLCTAYHPSIIDLAAGVIHPINLFLDPSTGVFNVATAQRGPFARVVNTDSCLNVRREPQLDGRIIDCFRDGVLLRDISHGLVYADEWLQVVVPGGEVGWAHAQYLER